MKIDLSQEQFRLLLDLIYAGNMVVNGHRNYEDILKNYDDVESHLFSLCNDFGLEDLAEYDEELNKFICTSKFEEGLIIDLLEEYDDYNFWMTLSMYLAQRDARKELGGINEENYNEVLKKAKNLGDMYTTEFIKNGLKNIKVDLE